MDRIHSPNQFTLTLVENRTVAKLTVAKISVSKISVSKIPVAKNNCSQKYPDQFSYLQINQILPMAIIEDKR